jgi:16S rRNA processing protein RimM
MARQDNPSPLEGEGKEGGRRRKAPSSASLPAGRNSRSAAGDAPPTLTPPHKGEGSASLVLLGEFGRAHGLKGEVRLKSFTQDPKAIAGYGPLQSSDGRRFTLKHVRPAGGGSPDVVIARVDGIATRQAAEALNRVALYAGRERLRGGQGEDEFLLADLIGLTVKDPRGQVLGTIAAVPNYGGGDLLEIAPPGGGPTGLLPFTQNFVPTIDIAAGEVIVNPPDGLFEEPGSP